MTVMDVKSCDLPTHVEPGAKARLVYWDGRLDNRGDLRAVLGTLAQELHDTELVLAVYQRWGVEGLGRVIGDWSLVICDPGRQVLLLASDFAGIRPLYYTHDRRRVQWSSRLDALVAATGVTTIDEEYVSAFLTLGGHPTRTPHCGILPVPAGGVVSITPHGATTRALWTMPITDIVQYADERRYDEQLRELFREAVAVRLQTAAPVIAELSGGLDSSSVVCMAHQLIRRGEVSASALTTVSYVHEDSLDIPYIREIEQFCGIEGIHLSTDRNPLVAADAVGHGSPQIWAPLHTAVARLARQLGASTFLTGQGGDLAMGNWFDDSLQAAAPLRAGQIWRAMKDALAWAKVLRVPIGWILLRALRASLPNGSRLGALYSVDALALPGSEDTSLRPAFTNRIAVGEPHQSSSTDWMQAPPERRKRFLALTIMREMRALQLLEPVRDLDYTHPFAHRPLVEFVMSVPPDVLCGPGRPRRLMRRALGDLWPPRLRARRSKSLFGAPWIEALRPLAAGLLQTQDWHVVSRGWIDRASLTSRLQRLIRGIDCNEPQLRQIILLEYWLRNRISETCPRLAA